MKKNIRIAVVIAAIVAAVAIAATIAVVALAPHTTPHASTDLPEPSVAELAKLREAKYDEVIGGLIPVTGVEDLPEKVDTYILKHDAALYGSDQRTPVARLDAQNFLNDNTIVLAVKHAGPWTLVLTPARQALPSKSDGRAAAQTAAWIRTADLTGKRSIDSSISISVSKKTLTLRSLGKSSTFAVGVGMDKTPTPMDVTGYLQARYLDAKQGQELYPIQLTSLHATAVDEPLPGGTGGLIGVHYQTDSSGQVSHGCIRLPADAITAVNQLPLGTPISITR